LHTAKPRAGTDKVKITKMDLEDGTTRKHKKHKKKHKHRRESSTGDAVASPKTSIKLKLKIGTETMGTKSVMSVIQKESEDGSLPTAVGGPGLEDDPSDEDQWLEALEKGTLDTPGELSKKDPALLTTRQRALLHGNPQDELLQLPSGYKTTELTDEQKQKRQEKAKKRRQQANEKMENDKSETINKLLKKQESKLKKAGAGKQRAAKKSSVPRISYRSGADGPSISLPPGVALPLVATVAGPYPQTQLCAVQGCQNPKTSVCSKSHVPVCGLACYKKNLATWMAVNSTELEVT